jgi:branched-chain amino acid transport system permease protein
MSSSNKGKKNGNIIHLAWFLLGILVFPWVTQRVPGMEHYLDVMVFAGIYSLVTIGLCLLMGFAGQISLGHASFFGLGAYISGVITAKYGINPWYCVPAGMTVSALVALLIGTPSLKLRGHYLAMATLAFCIIVTVVFNESISVTGGPDGLAFIPSLAVFGFALDSVVKYYYFVWIIIALVMLLCLNIIQSRVGRALRSIHDSEMAAGAVGVHVAKYKIYVFMLSAVLASFSGSLYAHYLNFINPSSFDLFVSIKLIIMIILGGMHSLWGAIVGAVLITFLSYEWLHYFEEAEVMVYGAIVLLIVIFLPEGVVSIPRKLAGLWEKARPKTKASRLKTEG